MPPKRKKRTRRRKWRPNWGPILGVVFAGNLLAGLWFSPITSVRKVRIVGAPEWDRGRLLAAVQSLRGRPALRVQPEKLESLVLDGTAVRDADFRRSIFGSATLTLKYERALASVENSKGAFLGASGALFRGPGPIMGLPVLTLHASALKPALTLAGGWPARPTADLIQKIPATLKENLRIRVDSEGAVCLNTRQGALVFLGQPDRIDEKLRALAGLMSEDPRLLEKAKELTLIEPNRPSWISKDRPAP